MSGEDKKRAKPSSSPSLPAAVTGGESPVVALVMGSGSDWPVLRQAARVLERLNIPFEARIVSAHRTPLRLVHYAQRAAGRGLKVLVAAAGGAAHLPGMLASLTPLPVLGVPVPTSLMGGLDSLFSIVQMPRGVAVGTLAVGEAGAINAALLAAAILALHDGALAERLSALRRAQSEAVPLAPDDDGGDGGDGGDAPP